MSYTGTIQIPVLFDMSGDTIVYGEDVTGDFVTSHLDFILDMTTEANDISLNATNISDAIKVGDQDNTDNLFYSGGTDGNIAVDNLCNRLSKAITRGKLVHIPKTGDHSNSGIPLGGRAELVDSTGTHTVYHIQNVYTDKYFTSEAPIGDEQMLGEAMARVASIHLVGTPLAAAAFEDKNSVQTDLETASGQTFNSGNTAFYNALAVQLSKVLGGSKSSAPMNNGSSGGGGYPLDASGTSVPALKSIYEQLMSVPGRSQIMQTRDVSGVVDNSNTTLAGGFPFITGDKLVMYLRPKIVFAAQTKAEQSTALVGFSDGITLNTPAFNVGRDGQGITGQTYSQSTQYGGTYTASYAFNGTTSGTYGWLSGGHFDNTTGAYDRDPLTNTSVDGANVAGGWAQVNVGKNVAVTSYKIYPQDWEKPSIGGRSPHIFKLVYSDDGTNFLTADSQTVGTSNTDTSEWATTNDANAVYIPKTFTLTNTKAGQYWRLIVSSVYGNSTSNGGFVSIQELELMGSDDYAGSGDSGGIDLSGIQTNIVATAENIEVAFPGNATTGPEPEMNKWGWMGSPSSDSLTLETTDVTDIRTIDLHIWKITITL